MEDDDTGKSHGSTVVNRREVVLSLVILEEDLPSYEKNQC